MTAVHMSVTHWQKGPNWLPLVLCAGLWALNLIFVFEEKASSLSLSLLHHWNVVHFSRSWNHWKKKIFKHQTTVHFGTELEVPEKLPITPHTVMHPKGTSTIFGMKPTISRSSTWTTSVYKVAGGNLAEQLLIVPVGGFPLIPHAPLGIYTFIYFAQSIHLWAKNLHAKF